MTEDFLSPVGNRHPNSHIADQSKKGPQATQLEEENFEEGTTEIPIPSKGLFYQPPYFCAEKLDCRPLDFRDEDILTTQRYIEDGSVFDKVVSAVIQNKGMNAGKLVPIDRDTILIWLRANSLGKDMTVEYTCVNLSCKKKAQATWDLSAIKIPEYEPEIYEELKLKGELKIVTPIKELTVFIKVPLIEESKDTEKKFTKQKENEKIDHDMYATASLSMIVSGIEVDGKIIRNKKAILDYFKKIHLPLGDSRWIRREVEKITLKYDTKQDLICPHCGNVQEGVPLPIIHQNFLWTNDQP